MAEKTSKQIVEDYLNQGDWRVKESSSAPYSFGALNKYMSAEVAKSYWLRSVYNPVNPKIAEAHREGFLHIHDLNTLSLYCCGYSLKELLVKGVRGVPNVPQSYPAHHFYSVLNQLANAVTIFQNEIAGAVAFSSVDTLLAPFIKVDKLNYKQVKQGLQNFIFSINSNSRAGAEPAFSNITLDLVPPADLRCKKAIIGGEETYFTYGSCQEEMNMFNRAFCELMMQGDAAGRPFSYPIPTYNIHRNFDWDDPSNDLLWEMTGKYGTPYFANFINSDMSPEDCRSMCCRLRIDTRELRKRNGGLFGSGDSTGSIGVVTLNLPRIGYFTRKVYETGTSNYGTLEEAFFSILKQYMDLSKDSLVIKRKWLKENILEKNMIPAFNEYVGTLDNHFNTIGHVGLNEMCVNLFNDEEDNILSARGKEFSLRTLDFMRERLADYQEETGQLFNLEATPAESTCFRLALLDVKEFGPGIYHQGTDEAPYYTNSCHMPVKDIKGIKQLFDHQDELQTKYTGGTVVHTWLAGPITAKQAKSIIKSVCKNYHLPYISLSPLNVICPEHGLLSTDADTCPICGKTTEKYQRITGYCRRVSNFNDGKKSEFKDRAMIRI